MCIKEECFVVKNDTFLTHFETFLLMFEYAAFSSTFEREPVEPVAVDSGKRQTPSALPPCLASFIVP
jgi:hypothetical protein